MDRETDCTALHEYTHTVTKHRHALMRHTEHEHGLRDPMARPGRSSVTTSAHALITAAWLEKRTAGTTQRAGYSKEKAPSPLLSCSITNRVSLLAAVF